MCVCGCIDFIVNVCHTERKFPDRCQHVIVSVKEGGSVSCRSEFPNFIGYGMARYYGNLFVLLVFVFCFVFTSPMEVFGGFSVSDLHVAEWSS